MSVGHAHKPHPNERHAAELKRIWATPWFQRGLRAPKKLIRSKDIPWLGGSSTDLRHIYVDPRFGGRAEYRGAPINAGIFIPAVVQHEGVEGICLVYGIDAAGKPYSYDGAHELATCAEEAIAARICKTHGLKFDRKAYQGIYAPFLKMTEAPPWRNLPADLNTEPYREDAPELYREIEKAMLRNQIGAVA